MDFPADLAVRPVPWLHVPRRRPLRLIETHATRGSGTQASQFGATVNWQESPNNVSARNPDGSPSWGSACNRILGHDGRVGFVSDGECRYSAGFGTFWEPGETPYSIDEYGESWEWCQSANQEEFTAAQYERGAIEYAKVSHRTGIPPVFVEIPKQTGTPPMGSVRHDRCENGYKLRKSDPGPRFREADFIALWRQRLAELQRGTEEEMAELKEVVLVQSKDAANKGQFLWTPEDGCVRVIGYGELLIINALEAKSALTVHNVAIPEPEWKHTVEATG